MYKFEKSAHKLQVRKLMFLQINQWIVASQLSAEEPEVIYLTTLPGTSWMLEDWLEDLAAKYPAKTFILHSYERLAHLHRSQVKNDGKCSHWPASNFCLRYLLGEFQTIPYHKDGQSGATLDAVLKLPGSPKATVSALQNLPYRHFVWADYCGSVNRDRLDDLKQATLFLDQENQRTGNLLYVTFDCAWRKGVGLPEIEKMMETDKPKGSKLKRKIMTRILHLAFRDNKKEWTEDRTLSLIFNYSYIGNRLPMATLGWQFGTTQEGKISTFVSVRFPGKSELKLEAKQKLDKEVIAYYKANGISEQSDTELTVKLGINKRQLSWVKRRINFAALLTT